MKWDNYDIKYDLRKWGDNGKTPYKGLTLTKKELENLYRILKNINTDNLGTSVYKKTKVGNIDTTIYDVFGEYKTTGKMKGYVTYTSWSSSPKLDIRCWNDDFTVCSKGVTLSNKEYDVLMICLKNELEIQEQGTKYDTSDLDLDLFI